MAEYGYNEPWMEKQLNDQWSDWMADDIIPLRDDYLIAEAEAENSYEVPDPRTEATE